MPTSPEQAALGERDGGHRSKVVSLDDFARIRAALRESDEALVLCHGVFDLLHPGHVAHLSEARAQGDRLVVSVTEDAYVNLGPGRPVFSHGLRMESLAALESVDWVVLSEHATCVPTIEAIQPDVYCKGREYAEGDVDGAEAVALEAATVERHGGEVRFLGGAVFSSTQLLNRHFDALPEPAQAFAEDFGLRHDLGSLRAVVERMAGLRVLVIGDVIVDDYVYCHVQGATIKDAVPSVRRHFHQRQWGGSFAVARHLSTFCGEVTLAGIAAPGEDLLQAEPPPGTPAEVRRVFEEDASAPTVVKERYVVENKLRGELTKVFSINHLYDPGAVLPDARERFRERITREMADHDVVLVMDYGHGLLDQGTMDVIQQQAPFLALNVQTNSSNYGFNPITKYERADTFCLDQGELALAFRERGAPEAPLLLRLREHFGASSGWLTLGSQGSLGVAGDATLTETPALTLHVRDTIGAGDAFFALAALSARLGEPVEVGSFLGNVAGALAVNITGNVEAVQRDDLVRFAARVLNV